MIIGVTGTIGAGKGTVVERLVDKGFKHFSVRAFISEEIDRRGLPVNRDNMTSVANDLRSKHCPEYIAMELFRQAKASGGDAVIESLRTTGEIDYLRRQGKFVLIAVDADPVLRYQRTRVRGSETDDITLEKFISDEEREMHSSDPHKQNISACIKLADVVLFNNATKEEFFKDIDEVAETWNQ